MTDGATDPLQQDATRVVARLLNRTVGAAHKIPRGVMTFKYLVESTADERFIVRFYPPGRETVLRCEPDLLARCRGAGLPVPLVVGDARRGPKAALD